MRRVLLLVVLLAPSLAAAQEPAWVFTEGPGFVTPSPAGSLVHDRSEVVVDEIGRALIPATDGTVALGLDGESWDSYSEQRHIIAVLDTDYFVTAGNLFFSGSGQAILNEYHGGAEVWSHSGSSEELVGGISFWDSGWVEHAAASPEGDLWVGVQQYEGYGPVSEPSGTPAGISAASVAYGDIEGEPEVWSTYSFPSGEVLYDLEWTSAGVFAGTDDGLFTPSVGSFLQTAFAAQPVYSVVETTAGTLLAAVGDGLLYRSTDGGSTWSEASSLPARPNDFLATESGVLAAVEGQGVFRSEDDGTTWTATDMTVSAESLAGLSTGPYYATGDGATLYRSEDGLMWAPEYFVDTSIAALVPTPEGMVARALRELYRYTGATWERLPLAMTRRWLTGLTLAPDGAYYLSVIYGQQVEEPGNYRSRLYRSTNAGASWTSLYTFTGNPVGLLATTSGTLLLSVFKNVEGGSLLRSTDGGATWTTVLSNLPPASLRQGPSGTARLNAGYAYWASGDDGQTWTEYDVPHPLIIRDLLTRPGGGLIATASDGVFVADGDGAPWVESNLTFSARAITTNESGDLFVGASGCPDDAASRVCRSTDGGATWSAYGLGDVSVTALAVNSGGVLFAGTTRGAHRTAQTTVDAEGESAPLAQASVYPNPFAQHTALRFSTAQPGRITVIVYDALGRAVRTLRDADLGAGSYTLPWDATALASGTYFVRIVTPSGVRTLPVTVVR